MHILAISDLHGFLPDIPECDLLLLAGDYCRTRNPDQQRRFLLGEFSDWLRKVPTRHIVGIAGNHDLLLQEDPSINEHIPWIYLQDQLIDIEGVKIYGTPWTPTFFDWAFMDSEQGLEKKFASIPKGLDILLSHGPAYRHLDKTINGTHAGSHALWCQVKLKKPNSHVFGHIHEERGILDEDEIRYYNVTHVNLRYEPRHDAVHIPLRAK